MELRKSGRMEGGKRRVEGGSGIMRIEEGGERTMRSGK